MVFTNNLKGYGGNPLICDDCDKGDVISKWKSIVDEFKQDKFWLMRRWERSCA